MKTPTKSNSLSDSAQLKRREFLSSIVASATIGAIVASCNKNDDLNVGGSSGAIDLGSGDIGLLNYAYALEQVQEVFYSQVISTPFDTSEEEYATLQNMHDHELCHREFFEDLINFAAIPSLEINFYPTVNFANRSSVLSTAKFLEDLIVSAYNGMGQLFTNSAYLRQIAKIVSVEARHAAYVRDLLSYGSFIDDTIINGLDKQQTPAEILAELSPFLISKLDASHLPTT